MRVRLPNFDQRLNAHRSPETKNQLTPPPNQMLKRQAVPAVPVPPVFQLPTAGVPGQVTPTLTSSGRSTTRRLESSTALTTQSALSSSTTISLITSSSSSALPSSLSISSSSSSSSILPSSTATSTTPVIILPTDTSLIFVNSFPTDFPVETQTVQSGSGSNGRGYAFLSNNDAADSMLLFLTLFLVFLFLTLSFIRVVRYMDDRRTERGAGKKVDQMVSEEMRWQEGREVMERKIIMSGGMSQGQGKGGMGQVGYSKLRREL